VFFFLPAALVLQFLKLVAEVPLYIEYQITTVLRARWTVAAPPVIGDIAAVIAAAGRSTKHATRIVLLLALVLAMVSIAVSNGQDNRFLVSIADLVNQFWSAVLRRTGATG